ncbi:unnamed protein product, partial [Ectocarpus fasciculatus]
TEINSRDADGNLRSSAAGTAKKKKAPPLDRDEARQKCRHGPGQLEKAPRKQGGRLSSRKQPAGKNVRNNVLRRNSEQRGRRPYVSGRRSTPRRALLFSRRSNSSNWKPSWSTRRRLYPPSARKRERIGRRVPSCASFHWSE